MVALVPSEHPEHSVCYHWSHPLRGFSLNDIVHHVFYQPIFGARRLQPHIRERRKHEEFLHIK